VDSIVVLGSHPNLTALGPEAWRDYSWSFNPRCVDERDERDMWSSWKVINLKDVALLARYDHVKTKCANMVERNPVVVR
jgi:hypothetical protein